MIRKININGLDIPSDWSFLTSETCRDASAKVSAEEKQWLKTREHFHIYREILAAVRSDCIFKAGNRILQLHEGEMIMLKPQERHTTGHFPDDHAIYLWCLLLPCQINMILWRNNRLDSISVISTGIFDQLLTKIVTECSDPAAKSCAEYEIKQIMSALICDFFHRDQVQSSQTGKSYQNSVMQKILTYIDSTDDMNCSLSSLASMAGYSRSHFQRLFYEYTGCPFRDFMEKKRIDRYVDLLRKSNLSKKEISTLLGFSSTAALNHWEKKLNLNCKS